MPELDDAALALLLEALTDPQGPPPADRSAAPPRGRLEPPQAPHGAASRAGD